MNQLNVALTLTADGKQLVTTVNGSKKVVSDLNTTLGKTGTQGRVASQGLNQVEVQGNKTNKALSSLKGQIAATFAGLSAIAIGQKVTQDLAAFQDIRTRLTQLSGSTAAYAQNEEYLMQLTRQHSKELIPLADNYARLLSLQDAGLVTQAQARSLLEGMSNAQSALGSSNEQLNQAMYGLSQALASPIVRAEELNQVVEPLPGILNKMDKAAGLSAGGFRRMVVDGKVTSEFFRNTLIAAFKDYDGAAAATAANISAQTRQMKNAWQQMVISFESPINDSLSPVLGSTTKALQWAADNSELLQTAIGGALVLALTRAGIATGSYLTQVTAKILKEREATAATIAEAKAEIHRATVMKNTAIASTTAAAADARLTAARNTLTAATQRANIAGRALNGVMALTGGPVGLAIMAASGVAYFAMTSDKAKKPTQALADEVARLAGTFKQLSHEERASKIRILGSQMNTARRELIAINKQIEQVSGKQVNPFGSDKGQLAAKIAQLNILKAKAKELETQINRANAEQQALFNDGLNLPTNESNGQTKSAESNKEQQKLLEQYTKQKALLNDTSEAAKVRYEIEHGKLKELDPVINAKILAAAKDYDATKKQVAAAGEAKEKADAQKRSLQSLLATLDPVTAAATQMAEKEKLLKAHFEQANVPLEKRKQLLAALKTEYTEPSEFDSLRGQLDPEFAENQRHQQNMSVINNELAMTPETELAKRQQINQVKEIEEQRHADAMREINGQMVLDFDQMWQDSVNRFSAGIGQVTADALFEAKGFGEGVRTVLVGVGKAAVRMLVEWGVQRLLTFSLEKGVNKAGAASAGAVMTTNAAAQVIQSGLNAFSSTAAIPIVGPALAPAAMATAMAATAPMASAVAGLAGSMIGMAHDGIDNIPQDGTWLLQKGERVVDKRTNADLKRALYSGNMEGKQGKRMLNIQQHNTIVVSNEAEAETLEKVLPELVEMTKRAVVDDLNERGEVWQASS